MCAKDIRGVRLLLSEDDAGSHHLLGHKNSLCAKKIHLSFYTRFA